MRMACCLVCVLGAAAAVAAEGSGPEIIVAPDQPVPCVYVDDPLVLSLKVMEPAEARVSVSLEDTIGRDWNMDLGTLNLPPGVERWYALKGAPAELGYYAVTATMTIGDAVFSRTVGMCRVNRPAQVGRSPLGLTVTGGSWSPGMEYALKNVGVRALRVVSPAADAHAVAQRLNRVGLKAALVLREPDAIALASQPGKLQVGEEWTSLQLPASAPDLLVKFRYKTALPVWAVAGSLDELRAFVAGPAAERVTGVVLEAPAPPDPAARGELARLNLPVSIALSDPAWIRSRSPVRLMTDILELLAGGIVAVYLPDGAMYDVDAGYAPSAALFNAFGTIFGMAEYVGRVPLAKDVNSLLFREGANWILVAWRTGENGDPVQVTLPLEGALSVTASDPFGNPVGEGVTTADGNLAAAVGTVPLLVRGAGGNLIARAAAARAMEIAADLAALPAPAGDLLADGFRQLLETVRKNPAEEGARARYLDLLRQWSQLEIAIAQGTVPRDAALPISRGLLRLTKALAAVEEGRGELFLEPVNEMIAETERLQTMYLTGTPPGNEGVRLRAEQVLADLRNLVGAAETLTASGRKIEAAALASAAQHYGKCLEVYARGRAAQPSMAVQADVVVQPPAPPARPETVKQAETTEKTGTGKEVDAADAAKQPAAKEKNTAAGKKEEPASLEPPAAEGEIVHVVVKGDNPYGIAKKYGVPLDDLLKWNNMTPKSRINIGDKIIIKKGKR